MGAVVAVQELYLEVITVHQRRLIATVVSVSGPNTQNVYIWVAKSSSGYGNYDGRKGGSQMILESM